MPTHEMTPHEEATDFLLQNLQHTAIDPSIASRAATLREKVKIGVPVAKPLDPLAHVVRNDVGDTKPILDAKGSGQIAGALTGGTPIKS